MKKIVSFCSAIALLSLTSLVQAETEQGEDWNALVVKGAPQLSLSLFEKARPDPGSDIAAWEAWSVQRLALMQSQGLWGEIIADYEHVPETVSPAYRQSHRVMVIEAYLAQGKGAEARALLLPMIWGDDGEATDASQALVWRRLLVYSYLVEGREQDAHAAALRFNQDYPEAQGGDDWQWLNARVLLNAERTAEALQLAQQSRDPRAEVVQLLAQFQGAAIGDRFSLQKSLDGLNAAGLPLELRQSLYEAALANAALLAEPAMKIDFMERLLAQPMAGVDLSAAAEALWQAYEAYGEHLANKAQLLRGNYEPWFDAARRYQDHNPAQSRALWVWLGVNAGDEAANQRAVAALADALPVSLLSALYLSSERYQGLASVPAPVVLKLIDAALAEGDFKRAVQLINMAEGKHAADDVDWQLRRARVQVLTGMAAAGATHLQQMLSNVSLNRPQMDYLILTALDLKNEGEHAQAYALLAGLVDYVPELMLHRQVVYWMADSLLAQQQYLQAAKLYLRSADLVPSESGDDWAQAARYGASQALLQAGLIDDAKALLSGLIAQSTNDAQRSQWQFELRQIERASHVAANLAGSKH